MVLGSTDEFVSFLCAVVWLEGQHELVWQDSRERVEDQPVCIEGSRFLTGLLLPINPRVFTPSLFFLVNKILKYNPCFLSTASKPGRSTAGAGATAMSWRAWKTITFSPGRPNTHHGSSMPMNIAGFCFKTSFCARISSHQISMHEQKAIRPV